LFAGRVNAVERFASPFVPETELGIRARNEATTLMHSPGGSGFLEGAEMTEGRRFSRRALLFSPCAYNLAETMRMIEIARAVRAFEGGGSAFDIRFISEGGEFDRLITEAGFPVERLEPRITPAQIERAYKLDKGETFGAAFSAKQCIEKMEGELAFIRKINSVAIVTGSYVTIPLAHRIAGVPLVWVVQSTWLESIFKHGAGMTGRIRPAPARKLADFAIHRLIDLWMRVSLLNPLNRAARHCGVPGFNTMFDYWRGDLNLVAESDDFTGAQLPSNYHFVGPIVAQQDFPIPSEISQIPHDRPIVYFAMGSSGTPIVGMPMQPEQSVNLAAIARKGFAIRVPKSKDPSRRAQAAIRSLLVDETAHRKAKAYAEHLRAWNGPRKAAEILLSEFGPEPVGGPIIEEPSPQGAPL
jgi:UDP:flavonoid glycosyltransferase YjiC (YdhE family)